MRLGVVTELFSGKISTVCASMLATIIGVMTIAPAQADVLKGGVEHSDRLTRLSRPALSGEATSQGSIPTAPARRISRESLAMQKGLVDASQFSSRPPISGRAQQDDVHLGLLKPNDFKLPAKFDLGAERNSKELTLAWEQWHKQLSKAIYERWTELADTPGKATVRITVTRSRTIKATILGSQGGPRFERTLLSVIDSLNGNQGLTFPSKSQRQVVAFEADYLADTHVDPGYSWVKNDYEKVRQDY